MGNSTAQLVITGLVTAVLSVLTSLLLSRLTFKFVRRAELKQVLADAVQLEREKRALTRTDAIREKVTAWAFPIHESANDLYYRILNICDGHGYLPLARDWDERRPENWSATHDYFINSSIYLFGRYFAHVELLRTNLGLEFYPEQRDKDVLYEKVQAVRSVLSKWPTDFTSDCSGDDRQVFLLDQQALGQAFFNETSTGAITYAEFLKNAGELNRFTSSLRDFLLDLQPGKNGSNCRWRRIRNLRDPILEVKHECHRIMQSAMLP
jgi:hypothetical protein